MEIEVENGLMVKINETNNTASVTKSPKVSGTVLIPRSIQYKGKEYLITSIESYSFGYNNKIDFLTFDDNSEIESLREKIFYCAQIKKLRIPAKIKKLDPRWCASIEGLTEIEISPNNHNFIYYNNEFLLGKSEMESKTFDILYFASFDIVEAVIPPQVKVIKDHAFEKHKNLKSVIFPENSELKTIEKYVFQCCSIQKLVFPATVENCGHFANMDKLTEIQISPKSKLFSLFDRCLVKKSDIQNDVFDTLIVVPRDIERLVIPSQIKFIYEDAFWNCMKLKTIVFEPNSSLEVIGDHGMAHTTLEKIVFPPSVKKADSQALYNNKNLKSVEFLGKNVKIGARCFDDCQNLETV